MSVFKTICSCAIVAIVCIGVCKSDDDLKSIHKQAKKGDAKAQFELGRRYENGDGIGKDPQEAAKWYAKAANNGYPEAQNELGLCYLYGFGLSKNPQEAIKWITKAAENGVEKAQYRLGIYYLCINKDPQETVKWIKKSEEQGNLRAQFILGCFHATGAGVKEDPQEAVKKFKEIVERWGKINATGYVDYEKNGYQFHCSFFNWLGSYHDGAQLLLGVCHAKGDGVKEDEDEAAEYYERVVFNSKGVCEEIICEASLRLGFCYFMGIGVLKDAEKGASCLSRAGERELLQHTKQQYQIELSGNEKVVVRLVGMMAQQNLKSMASSTLKWLMQMEVPTLFPKSMIK